MRILRAFRALEEPCPYLAEERWRLDYLHLEALTPEEYDACLEAGWFKYGHHLQRPACAVCNACRSLRVPTAAFTLSRAQRRTLARNSHRIIRYSSPPPSDLERVDLHNRYRMAQAEERGWGLQLWDTESYRHEFSECPLPMTEISIWDGSTLCAVVLADVGREALAGVTHYYDPALRDDGIGRFAMLQTFRLAQDLGKRWVYLGYYVPDSPTMGYKNQFRPAEVRCPDGHWRPLADDE